MDVFGLRSRVIDDYSSFVRSFITIRDDRVRERVRTEFERGAFWPDPLVQLNPAFEPGGWVEELVDQGLLHPECARIFRKDKDKDPAGVGVPLRLHRHQADAIRAVRTGLNYVLTTGTGSGKSLAYIVPIVDHVLRRGSGRGVQAIVVYPMNALANSQLGELQKFLERGYPDGPPVTFDRYTGQESRAEREEIIRRKPDILLTNYVMLELMLTRPIERRGLIAAARGLSFLVLDELHTYRGRQGADVSMLVRRVREACEAEALQCVGTSATLSSKGSVEEQRHTVARTAARLFGAPVEPAQVIVETLRRATDTVDETSPAFHAALVRRLESEATPAPPEYASFVRDPLAVWVETTFGLAREKGTDRLIRTTPRAVTGPGGAARALSDRTGAPEDRCARAIQETLLAGHDCPQPETGFPVFAFRLHQFISKGDTVYASPESEGVRHVTLDGQRFVPGADRTKVLFPLLFCRECGREYFSVWRTTDPDGTIRFTPRQPDDRLADGGESGYLYIREDDRWPGAGDPGYYQRVPDEWLDVESGIARVRPARQADLPTRITLDPDGRESAGGVIAQYIRSPYRFCLSCGVSYGLRQKSDFGKLGSLGTEGRASATSVLSLSAVRHLREDADLPDHARKLLSFTDNRQDASLQAGHFNDFVFIGLLRSAVYRAVDAAGPAGIRHDELSGRLFDALQLPFAAYARDPDLKHLARLETDRALRDVLAYRVYCDLQRGWRINSPNLEQCGLLHLDYASIDDIAADEALWADGPGPLALATPAIRAGVARVLLDFMRRGLAIRVDVLDARYQERIGQRSFQRLRDDSPWALDGDEKFVHAATLFPRSQREGEDYGGNLFLSARGSFGTYLRRPGTFGRLHTLDTKAAGEIIRHLLGALRIAGLVEVVQDADSDEEKGYQVPAAAFVWTRGDGERGYHDPIRQPGAPADGPRVNPFFVEYYRRAVSYATVLEAREHTAQVNSDDRADRERRFRSAELPILYCSPTMELGVDIKDLNVVSLRNVPPTPANYAQRSGRAGRSGQPALVYTYCSSGSAHDQHFFRRPAMMVSGKVAPPRIDIANEDLVRAHVHAIWLAETGLDLGSSLKECLDVDGDPPSLTLRPSIEAQVLDPHARGRARVAAASLLGTIAEDLKLADWYSDGWLDEVLQQIPTRFDEDCERWRDLYRAALRQRDEQNRVIGDASRSAADKKVARKLRGEAEDQIELLLKSDNALQSDFYSYRYFASEGFLPGYNFPRLPLTAYLPGFREKTTDREYITRPRFIAISEFGPRSLIYHEGARYEVLSAMLPATTQRQTLASGPAKVCDLCGYLHDRSDLSGTNTCENCGAKLPHALRDLFRLSSVKTRKRDRITSDEEERLRLGYDIVTVYRFEEHGGHQSKRTAEVVASAEHTVATLAYGQRAQLWRINFGWRRRKNPHVRGFPLDLERGTWGKEKDLADDPDDAEPTGARVARVIPFVEDHRNCLVLTPTETLSREELASLEFALKNAIQVCYQLEDSELATELLPSDGPPRAILLYESAEGGAGVLRRLVDGPGELADVARNALQLCHFDPDTGDDLGHAEGAREECVAACYDCLLSYSNQRLHALLDRHRIRALLLRLASADVRTSPSGAPRAGHLAALRDQCQSELERRFLRRLDERGHRLPTHAQRFVPQARSRPDFLYVGDFAAAIYVDGPFHDYPERQRRDVRQQQDLEEAGITVVRFGAADDWDRILDAHPGLFGPATDRKSHA